MTTRPESFVRSPAPDRRSAAASHLERGERSLPPPAGTPFRPPIDSATLLAGASEVGIVHRGSLYRLKQTALGKLILTK